jgi:hypothetical protein
METERIRATKMEAAKWSQASKNAQKRFELELKTARKLGWDERDAVAKNEVDRLCGIQTLSAQQMTDKYEAQLEELRRDKALALEHLQNVCEGEREDAVRQVEKEVSARKDKEWGDTLRQSVTKAEEEARKLWADKLKRESDRLEKFREDVSRQSQNYAVERQELLDRISRQEDIATRMEALNGQEIEKLKHDFEDQKEKLRQRLEKAKAKTLVEQQLQFEAAKEALEARLREEMQVRVLEERSLVQTETERQLSQLQDESEKLVIGLEGALNDLRLEKSGLAAELEATATKLEEAEDAHYDLEQKFKQSETSHSLAVWRLATNCMRLKVRFKKSMEKLTEDNNAAALKAKTSEDNRIEDLRKAAQRLLGIVEEMESMRRRLHNTLTQYKVDTLTEHRTQIRLCERELQRLAEERDGLESQREHLEDEVNELQAQVHEVEEQIREHNRSSAVQNGRINVAHARKKRRLDNELERLFDLIEQKREQITELEERLAGRSRERDDKKVVMVDLEKALVQILLEQQRLVLSEVDTDRAVEERCNLILRIGDVEKPTIGQRDAWLNVTDVTSLRLQASEAEMKRNAEKL